MQTFVTVVHMVTCALLILLVLIQSGKGAEISASLGGSSQTVFGSSGGANFFTRFTSVMAAIFFCTSIGLTLLGAKAKKSVFEGMGTPLPAATAPATTPAAGGAAPAAGAAATTPAAPADAAQQKGK